MPIPDYFEFQDRTRVVFQVDAIDEIGKEAQKLGASSVMIVADAIVRKLGFVDRIEKALASQGVRTAAVFDEVPENSEVEVVKKARAACEESGAEIVIAIGGGSVMDTAKCVNLLISLGGDLMDDYQGANMITQPLRPMIAAPTTAGTGSEVTFAAVILNKAEDMKLSFLSPYLAPAVAILDPRLTVTMPPRLTASTGMDALTHAVEGMLSTMRGPFSDALCHRAIRMIMKSLPAAVKNGEDLEARSEMLMASTLAGLGFANSLVGIVHAVAHATGGICHTPHGLANSIYLPHGMRFNLGACPEVYVDVADAMGLDVKGLDATAAGEKAIAAVESLTRELGQPRTLREAGVTEDKLEQIAEYTLMDGAMVTNPREVYDSAEVLDEILRKAF